jgi:hypothetical protein
MYSAASEGTFIYVEGNEHILAQDIREYVFNSDREYDVEIK